MIPSLAAISTLKFNDWTLKYRGWWLVNYILWFWYIFWIQYFCGICWFMVSLWTWIWLLATLWPQLYGNRLEMSTKINLTPFELLVVLAVPSTDGHNADNRLYYCIVHNPAILQHDISAEDDFLRSRMKMTIGFTRAGSVEARNTRTAAGYLFINSVRGWIFHHSRAREVFLPSRNQTICWD